MDMGRSIPELSPSAIYNGYKQHEINFDWDLVQKKKYKFDRVFL